MKHFSGFKNRRSFSASLQKAAESRMAVIWSASLKFISSKPPETAISLRMVRRNKRRFNT